MKLKDLKAANQVELAEYDVVNYLADKPAFKWWVPHVIRKRNQIINKMCKSSILAKLVINNGARERDTLYRILAELAREQQARQRKKTST